MNAAGPSPANRCVACGALAKDPHRLLVRGLQLLVGGLQLLVGRLQLLDGGLEVLLLHPQIPLERRDMLVPDVRFGGSSRLG